MRYGPIIKSPAKCHKDDLWDQGISPVMKGWESWGWPRWSPEVPPSLNYSGLLWSCQSLCFFIKSDWERYFDTSFIKITDTLFLQWSGKQKIKWSGGIGEGGTKKPNQTIPGEVVNSPEAKTDLSTEMSSGFSPLVVQVWDFFWVHFFAPTTKINLISGCSKHRTLKSFSPPSYW